MNKLIGYTTITVGDEVIPVKIGCGALREFLLLFGLSQPHDIYGALLTTMKIEVDGVEAETRVPADPFKFAAAILWSGADYVNRRQGGPGYKLEDAYEWLDEIGALDTEEMKRVYKIFWASVRNGGLPVKELPGDEKKSVEQQ